jgi:hypothetical protein
MDESKTTYRQPPVRVYSMTRVPCGCPACAAARRADTGAGVGRDGKPGNVWAIVYHRGENPVYETGTGFGERHPEFEPVGPGG